MGPLYHRRFWIDVTDTELEVRLPGPWEGPIRVVERTTTSFRFVTLEGHMEAGEIAFRAGTGEGGSLRFEIVDHDPLTAPCERGA